jgi:IclR family transcriptional regulator, pca regulon regulatory protein
MVAEPRRSGAAKTPRKAPEGSRSRGRATSGVEDRAAAGSYHVEALARGLRILGLFSERRPALRLSDMAEITGLPVPTVFRLVHTLEHEGFVERLPDGLVRPAPAVLTLGFAALQGQDVVQVSAQPLRALADATAQTVNLGVLTGDSVLYLVRLRNTDLVTANLQVGSTAPAVCTSMGKLLLAQLPQEDLRNRLGPESFDACQGPNAIGSLTALKRQLLEIRRDSWATQDEEVAQGLRSIAGPLRDSRGVVVAAVNIAVQAHAWPMARIHAELREPLLDTCRDISRRLGAPLQT